MKNIEIKAKYNDLDKGRKIAENMNARYVGQDHQIDTYFTTPKGRLKLRESSISGAQLVPYVRENTQEAKQSNYLVIPIVSPEETKNIFSAILGVDIVVEKYRHIYLTDNVRIHLDEVVNLGSFFELEAVCDEHSIDEKEIEKVNKLLEIFQVKKEDLQTNSYKELLRSFNQAK